MSASNGAIVQKR